MLNKLTLIKTLIIWFVLSLILVINIFLFQSIFIGLIFGIAYLLFFGFLLGQFILNKEELIWQFVFGLLFLVSTISIIGAIVYFFLNLNSQVVAILITLIPLAIIFLPKKNIEQTPNADDTKWKISTLLLVTCYLLLAYASFKLLFQSQTVEAIRSPWWVVEKDFFIIYFLATFTLLTLLFYNKKIWLSLILTSVHTFLTLSVAMIVYKLGYGFDPFLHQATEKVIATLGQINPKPLYYLGQYSLVAMFAKLFQISTQVVDKLLLIGLVAIYLPVTIYFVLVKVFDSDKRNYVVTALLFLLIPFSTFIVTTPQGLANLFSILVILFSFALTMTKEIKWFIPVIILTITTLAIHPLAGIPILIFVALLIILNLLKSKKDWFNFFKKTILLEIIILASIALPLIFVLFSTGGGSLTTSINKELISNPNLILEKLNIASLYLKNHFNLIFDLIYLYNNNLYWIIVIISLLGLATLIYKNKNKKLLVYPLTFFIVIINFWILKNFISFPGLIEYERINYPQRLFEISFYFLLPLFLYALYIITSKIRYSTKSLKIALLIFLSLFITTSLYLAYPRDDDYHLDRGYNLTQADINAVRYINKDGENDDYIVLANQMTSAAAIKEFSFFKYFYINGNTYFYYPLPTGDPLYQYYLDMSYERPKKETAYAAMELMGVNTAYFVINKYWWQYDIIVDIAKVEADSWVNIDNGRVYVFKYTK
ncbi:hypothetical protein KKA15_00925 [Patescibacteria group bacterium]|nr:hypothetical protein [Patescibacteria group bacterium]